MLHAHGLLELIVAFSSKLLRLRQQVSTFLSQSPCQRSGHLQKVSAATDLRFSKVLSVIVSLVIPM